MTQRHTPFVTVPVVAVALACLSPVDLPGQPQFSRDTVWEDWFDRDTQSSHHDSVRLRNVGLSAIVVDSIGVLLDTTEMPECHVQCICEDGGDRDMLFLAYYSGYGSPPPTGLPLSVAAHDSVLLTNFEYDLCIACPLSVQGLGKSAWDVGDSIWVSLAFHSASGSDTLTVKGIRVVTSTSVEPGAGRPLRQHALPSEPDNTTVLLNGRTGPLKHASAALLWCTSGSAAERRLNAAAVP